MIRVENLSKKFGDTDVLNDISVDFNKGKINLIIGQSGSGKTVFLKCLLGLYRITSGKVLYNGVSYFDIGKQHQKKIRSEIGTVFQGSALFDSMTVEENVRFPLEMFTKKTKGEMLFRVNEVLERVNLRGENYKYPSELSGGMKKRVAIARAVAANPEYLFCDEPNSGLDPKTAMVIDNLIHEITVEYNTTTIINTHDMNSVMEIGEKIVFINNGKKEWEGYKKDILNSDNKAVNNFVFTSDLFKTLKAALNNKNK